MPNDESTYGRVLPRSATKGTFRHRRTTPPPTRCRATLSGAGEVRRSRSPPKALFGAATSHSSGLFGATQVFAKAPDSKDRDDRGFHVFQSLGRRVEWAARQSTIRSLNSRGGARRRRTCRRGQGGTKCVSPAGLRRYRSVGRSASAVARVLYDRRRETEGVSSFIRAPWNGAVRSSRGFVNRAGAIGAQMRLRSGVLLGTTRDAVAHAPPSCLTMPVSRASLENQIPGVAAPRRGLLDIRAPASSRNRRDSSTTPLLARQT